MQYRNVGRSGLQVSVAGLGCNNFGMVIDEAQAERVVQTAIDAGINLFDTADMYGAGASEESLGKALGARRSEVLIATKFRRPMGEGPLNNGGSRRYIYNAVEASLRRLGTDYIDLFQYHDLDPLTPLEETLEALTDLVREGKVRYIGSSNLTGWQIADADWMSRSNHWSRFVSVQREWSLVNRGVETEVVPSCEEFGVGIIPFMPLASGFLTGKYQRGEALPEGSRFDLWERGADKSPDWLVQPHKNRVALWTSGGMFDRLEALTAFAEEHGHSMLELALCWMASMPAVSSVISGATKPEQVTANVEALNSWTLSAEELAGVDRASATAGAPDGARPAVGSPG